MTRDPGVRKTLGNYVILGPLNSGGMGEVYIARDRVLARKVAIKMLPVRVGNDADVLRRFTQEARSASALNHPNIVTIHEVGTEDGIPFIVMEYVDGRDLRQYINEGRMENLQLLDIASQIADGLAAAHERGIVHRDLKPENLMITKDGFVKILDFGLAKMVAPELENDSPLDLEMPGTRPGTILGTIGYMSPEQATGRRLDFRSDQFAFGSILYELATGRPAFDGDTAVDTLSAILHQDPRPIGTINNHLPRDVSSIVYRLLSKDPDDRYGSTRDLARELRSIRDRLAMEHSDSSARAASRAEFDQPQTPRSARLPRPGYSGPPGVLLRLTAVIVPLVAVAVSLLIWRNHRSSDLPSRRFVAVVPFSAPAQDYAAVHFAEGLSELVSVRLAAVPALHVVASPLVSAGASQMTLRQIAAEAGATLLLTGSLRRTNDQVTIQYAVVEPESQKEIVKGSLTATLAEAWQVEERIVVDVCRKLNLEPSEPKAPDLALRNAAAQRTYIDAIGLLNDEYALEEIDKAIRDLTRLLDSAPGSPLVNIALGRAFLARYRRNHEPSDAQLALTFARRGIQSGRTPAIGHALVGRIQLATGNWKEAIEAFDQASVNVPQGISLLEVGRAYEGSGLFYEAINRYRRVIAAWPNPDGFAGIGRCETFLRHLDRALAAYEEAAQLNPADARVLGGLALTYQLLDRIDESRDTYQRALDAGLKVLQASDDAAMHADVALWFAQLGDRAKAADHLELAFQIDPRDPVVSFNAALIASMEGQAKEATEHIARAKALGYSHSVIEYDPRLIR